MGSVQGDDSFTEILSWTLHIHILVSKYRYSVCSRSTVVGSCGRLDMNVVMKSQSNRVTQSVCLCRLLVVCSGIVEARSHHACILYHFIIIQWMIFVIRQATTNKSTTHIAPTRALLPPLI